MKFLGALPQAPSAACRNKATIFYTELTLIEALFDYPPNLFVPFVFLPYLCGQEFICE